MSACRHPPVMVNAHNVHAAFAREKATGWKRRGTTLPTLRSRFYKAVWSSRCIRPGSPFLNKDRVREGLELFSAHRLVILWPTTFEGHKNALAWWRRG